MCRWIAYKGRTIPLERYVTEPQHSLVRQSIDAKEALGATQGDGFGLGWYAAHQDPGLYREVRPAWSDENLKHLCRHIHAHLFFAHVRAATSTPTTRPNCHPFTHGRFMFMHNGSLGDWDSIRRKVEALIPDALYTSRVGTTDSEAAFLAILGAGAETDPVGALTRTVARITDLVHQSGKPNAFRFTSALTDGETLYAVRYAMPKEAANTLYFREDGEDVVVASEPLDAERSFWKPVPANHLLILPKRGKPRLEPFLDEARVAAA
ncbi:MAG: class II glutamine amidotransferase [Hyphomicrobiales bacterium]|nr:class II glutamine amidotransferase [Hyphomicrobiales bacterium]